MKALIKNGYVVTMNEARATFARGFVSIGDDGRIVAAGDMADCPTGQAGTVIDADGMIVLPGLINAHTCPWHALVRGAGHRWTGAESGLHSALAAGLQTSDVQTAAALYAAQMIRTGTTCIVNHSPPMSADGAAAIVPLRDAGVRHVFATAYRSPGDADAVRALVQAYGGNPDRLVTIALALETAPNALQAKRPNEKLIEQAYALAKELDLRISTVSSGGDGYEAYAGDIRRAGRSHVMHLMELGVLDERWLLVQPALLDDTDIGLIRESGCNAVYTPLHDAFRGVNAGRWAMLSRELNCVLGTGGALYDASDDMVEQIKACTMIQNTSRLDAAAMSIETGLEMATINAARALGLADEIGSLEARKRADIAVFDLNRPYAQVSHKPISTFISTGRGADAHAVFIDGQRLLNGDRLTGESTESPAKAASDGQRLMAQLVTA